MQMFAAASRKSSVALRLGCLYLVTIRRSGRNYEHFMCRQPPIEAIFKQPGGSSGGSFVG
jgi:hypothetical protein